MDIRDSAATRADSFSPQVHRLLLGDFTEGAGYATYRRRGTTDWLLVHTLEGRGHFGTATSDIPALPGTTILVRPGVLHDYGVEPTLQHWHFLFAHFHPRPEWLALLDWPEAGPGIGLVQPGPQIADRVVTSLREALRLSDGVLRHTELLSINAFEAALLWCDTQNSSEGQIDERLLRAIELIDRDLQADLDIVRLARASRLSVSRFAHLFRTQLGISPQRFVERRRLDAAGRLLDMTSRPISSVAQEVGFQNPLYFSTRFRRHTGVSPTAYRSRNNQV